MSVDNRLYTKMATGGSVLLDPLTIAENVKYTTKDGVASTIKAELDSRWDGVISTGEMPVACEELEGKIRQYIGDSNAYFTHGRFYECVADTTVTPHVYSWENIGVQTQYLRISSFNGISGDPNTFYYLDTANATYSAGLYIWDEDTGFTTIGGLGSGESNVFVGLVGYGGSMPIKRANNTDLVLGDYVKPNPSSAFPITVEGITFSNVKDSAVYMGNGSWVLNASPYQDTSETSVKSAAVESISGTASFQSDINKEIRDNLTFAYTQTVKSPMWTITHNLNRYPSVTTVDMAGTVMYGEVIYINANEIVIKFGGDMNGRVYLS